jgi:hypothetical protein
MGVAVGLGELLGGVALIVACEAVGGGSGGDTALVQVQIGQALVLREESEGVKV